jgi:hypothetical protein
MSYLCYSNLKGTTTPEISRHPRAPTRGPKVRERFPIESGTTGIPFAQTTKRGVGELENRSRHPPKLLKIIIIFLNFILKT